MQGCESTACTIVLGSAPPCGFAPLCIYGAVLSQRPVQVAVSPNATFTRILYIKYFVDNGELHVHLVIGCCLLSSMFPAPSATPRRSGMRLTLVNLTLGLLLDGVERREMHQTAHGRLKIKRIFPSSTGVTSNMYMTGRVIGGLMRTRLRLRRSTTHKAGVTAAGDTWERNRLTG
jgi:hypothetical protein